MNSAQRVVILLLAGSIIAGAATGNAIYYRLSYFWALLFLGSWLWSLVALRGLRLERNARTLRAQVGQVFEERFEISNESRLWRLWLEVRNESPLTNAGGSQVLTLMGGKQRRIYWSQTLLTQRGVFPLGPTVLASGDLFGLFPVSRTLPVKESLLVLPMMFDIRSFPNPAGLLPGGEALRRRTHQITPNASGVREYLPGDAMNRIHWASTARRDRLMVKEFELDPLAEVWLFLDAEAFGHVSLPTPPVVFDVIRYWKQVTKVALPPSTEEYMVSIAASVARHFIRRGRSVGVVGVGQHNILIPPDRGGRQLGKILEALALLKTGGEVPIRGLVETQVKHVPRGSTVVLVTPTVQIEFAYVMEHIIRRGLRPVVVLVDAHSFGGLPGTDELANNIRALGVPVRVVKNGMNLEVVLSENQREKAVV